MKSHWVVGIMSVVVALIALADDSLAQGPREMPNLQAARTMEGSVDVFVIAPKGHSVLVLGLELGKPGAKPGTASSLIKGEAKQGGLVGVEGELLVEDIGPQARLPGLPRWRFGGKTLVTLAPMVPAGAKWRALSVRKPGDASRVFMRYVLIPISVPLLRVGELRREEVAPPKYDPGRAWGWVPVARVRTDLTPIKLAEYAGEVIKGDQQLRWPKGAKLLEVPESPLPEMFQFGARTDDIGSLPQKTLDRPIQ